jgi:hypothetical protein
VRHSLAPRQRLMEIEARANGVRVHHKRVHARKHYAKAH